MKKKIVLWGHDDQDQKILVALELLAKENKVAIHTFSEEIVTKELESQMMDMWRLGKEVNFPEGAQTIQRDLQLSTALLPDNIKVVKTDLINLTKTEWAVYVLSIKMYESFESELEELKEHVENLSEFSKDKWEEMKSFWNRVQEQVRERNIYSEQANTLKKTTNELFEKLKVMRNKMDSEFKNVSKTAYDEIGNMLDSVEQKIDKGVGLNDLFNQLKKIQKEYTSKKFTKDHRNRLWSRLDKAYKDLKHKKYGDGAYNDNSAVNRLKKRLEGLNGAIQRMESSVRRDQGDFDFHMSKNNRSSSQLEVQLREAKLLMVKERLSSKKTKLDDMYKTKEEVLGKIQKAEKQEAQRKEKAAKDAAKKETQKKIAEEKIAASKSQVEAVKEALTAASKKVKEDNKTKKAPLEIIEESKTKEDEIATKDTFNEIPVSEEKSEDTPIEEIVEKAIDKVEDVIEDVVDTAKAISNIITDKIDEITKK